MISKKVAMARLSNYSGDIEEGDYTNRIIISLSEAYARIQF